MLHAGVVMHILFDRTLLRKRRERFAHTAYKLDFMKQMACDLVEDALDGFSLQPASVLDVCAHHGQLSTRLHRRYPAARIVQTDLSYAMLHYATKTSPHSLPVQCDEEWLPFAPASFDLIVSALGLHWVNDLPGVLVQCKRLLRPGGWLVVIMPGGQSLQEWRILLHEAMLAKQGGISPVIAPFIDAQDAASLLQRAGFKDVVTSTDMPDIAYRNPLDTLQELRGMGEANIMLARNRYLRRDVLAHAASAYYQRFAHPSGGVRLSIELVSLCAS